MEKLKAEEHCTTYKMRKILTVSIVLLLSISMWAGKPRKFEPPAERCYESVYSPTLFDWFNFEEVEVPCD